MTDNPDNESVPEAVLSAESMFIDPASRPELRSQAVYFKFAVTKPRPDWWVRVHPDPSYQKVAYAIGDSSDFGNLYLIHPSLAADPNIVPPEHIIDVRLAAAVTRQRKAFIWPLKLPTPEGVDNDAWSTAREAARLAETDWISVRWDRAMSEYVTNKATGDYGEPNWPDGVEYPFSRWIDLGFKGRMVTEADNVLLKNLRGE